MKICQKVLSWIFLIMSFILSVTKTGMELKTLNFLFVSVYIYIFKSAEILENTSNQFPNFCNAKRCANIGNYQILIRFVREILR